MRGNADLKAGCLVAGMAAGADSVDDMDVLRHGAPLAVADGDGLRHHPAATANTRTRLPRDPSATPATAHRSSSWRASPAPPSLPPGRDRHTAALSGTAGT